MHLMIVRSLCCLLLLTLTACQSTGTKIPHAELTQLVPSETQYVDIVARWEPPTSDTLHPDHARVVTYVSTQGQANPLNDVPFGPRLVGGSTSEHTTVIFTFDPHGRLLQSTATQGSDKRNIGLLNGQRQSPFLPAGACPAPLPPPPQLTVTRQPSSGTTSRT